MSVRPRGTDARVPIEAVLFDFAGTLFTPCRATDLVANAARTIGAELSASDRAGLAARYLAAGLPGGPYPAQVPAHLARLYARRDLSPAAHRQAYVGLLSTVDQPHSGLPEAIYAEILQPRGWGPYADARATVAALRDRGLRVGLISNIGFDLRPILRDHGFEELAHGCTLSYEAEVTKPDPRLFAAALRMLGADAARTVMVGDHPEADGGGAALGIMTLILPMTEPGSVHGLGRVLSLIE